MKVNGQIAKMSLNILILNIFFTFNTRLVENHTSLVCLFDCLRLSNSHTSTLFPTFGFAVNFEMSESAELNLQISQHLSRNL